MGTNYYFELKNLPIEKRIKQFIKTEQIHICKISAGWKPLLRACKYFSTVKELRAFYYNNSDILQIVDEYGEDIKFDWFMDKLEKRINEKNVKTHDHKNPFCNRNMKIYTDEDGCEWIEQKFS